MRGITFLVLLFFISACSPASVEQSIFKDSNCQLPCWNNIVPGITTTSELEKNINSLAVVDPKTISVNREDAPSIYDSSVTFGTHPETIFSRQPSIKFQIDISQDVVRTMTFCGNLNLSIKDITNLVGEPRYIITNGNYVGGKGVILFNPEKGVQYWYLTNMLPENLREEISPEINIYCISLFDSNMYNKMLEAGEFSMGFYNRIETLRVMYDWNGYGNLNNKYPSRQP